MPRIRPASLATSLLVAAGCGGGSTPPETAPAPAPVPVSVAAPASTSRSNVGRPLPVPPLVDGPLDIRVQYPAANQVVSSRDSNFMFGSIGSGRATLLVNGTPARVYPNGAFMVYLANPSPSAPSYELVAARGTDTARSTLAIRYPAPRVAPVPPPRKPENLPTTRADTIAALGARIDSLQSELTRNNPIGVVQLGTPSPANDTDVVIIGRPTNAGTYKWFFTPGTLVSLVSYLNGEARVRLDDGLDVWVDSSLARPMPAGTALPRRTTSNMRVRASRTGADVVIPLGARAPYFVEEGDRSIALTLYGVRGNTDIVNYASADSLVRTVEWVQVAPERVRITVNLRSAPYGYLVVYENNALVLKVRGRPAIDPSRPLNGLTIAVDPGHPPIGATGPTGLYEAQAVLPVGMRLKRMLEDRGATVVMTRTTDAPVALDVRPIIARKANVNAFVSIHLNAYPDGVNPFLHPGSGTYFFRTHSEPLAREVQKGLVANLSLEDLGVNYDNLAVVRGTWYPAVLCEGAFIILPDQEAALRTPEYQERYAQGIVEGLEAYFRKLPQQ